MTANGFLKNSSYRLVKTIEILWAPLKGRTI